jgi:hypothetical protein
MLSLVALLSVVGVSAQEMRYSVVETPVTAEEYERAFGERGAYNYVRDTLLDDDAKMRIVEATIATFSDEELLFYTPEETLKRDLYIENIGRYPNGVYAVDLISYSYETQFFDRELRPYKDRAQMSYASAYSTDDIFVGCDIFDCDPRIRLKFYIVDADGGVHEVAEYENLTCRLPYEYNRDIDPCVSEEYVRTPIFWHDGSLYYIAIEWNISTNSNQIVYYRLALE